jgi:phosphatidylinositol alpha-1,6-mannosyltransferase
MDYPPAKGGIQTYSRELAVNLVNKGFRIIVLTVGVRKANMRINGVSCIRCPGPFRFPIFGPSFFIILYIFYTLIISLIYKPKIIHVIQWYPCGLAALFVHKCLRIKYVVSTHGLEIYSTLLYSRDFFKKLMKIILEGASTVIAVSKFTCELVLQITKRVNIEVIPPFFNYTILSKREPNPNKIIARHKLQGRCVLLTVGRLIERKGHDTVIRALPKILEKKSNVVYLIVGDGLNRRKLEKLAENLGVKDKVIFAGEVSDQDLIDYYSMCDVFIMPCREIRGRGDIEGFGIVFIEAMFFGKPIIAGRSGGAVDPIIHGIVGFQVNPYDPEEVAERVIQLLSDEKIRHQISKNAKNYVRKYYPEFLINHIINIYERAILIK